MNINIISMSKVYESEDFYRPFICEENIIDCTSIDGTNCYADKMSCDAIRKKIFDVDYSGIHFIDSGNYHYLSFFFLEKINVDFELVLFDNHPDCKIPAFGEILSCGGWIKNAFDNILHLKKVYMIGVNDEYYEELNDLKDYISCVEIVNVDDLLEGKISVSNELPVYISIDKDVLREEYVSCNWDQGEMSSNELIGCIGVLKKSTILGVDVCGEPDYFSLENVHLNNEMNYKIIKQFDDYIF